MVNIPAPLGGRCVAYIIDYVLSIIACYCLWKDGMRDGRSLGKGLMLIQSEKRHVGDLITGTMVVEDK